MMNTEQMQAEFLRRYEDIVASGDTRQMEALEAMLQGAGYQTAERPYYNEWALLAAMSMILSDDGETLRRVLGTPSHPASNEEMLAAVYQLALDRLKDRDGKFNIRKYFDI